MLGRFLQSVRDHRSTLPVLAVLWLTELGILVITVIGAASLPALVFATAWRDQDDVREIVRTLIVVGVAVGVLRVAILALFSRLYVECFRARSAQAPLRRAFSPGTGILFGGLIMERVGWTLLFTFHRVEPGPALGLLAIASQFAFPGLLIAASGGRSAFRASKRRWAGLILLVILGSLVGQTGFMLAGSPFPAPLLGATLAGILSASFVAQLAVLPGRLVILTAVAWFVFSRDRTRVGSAGALQPPGLAA